MIKKYGNILKKLLAFSLALGLGVSCFACKTCTHRDANDDGVCDSCGVEFTDGDDLSGGSSSSSSSSSDSSSDSGSSDVSTGGDGSSDGEQQASKCELCRGELTAEGECEFCDGELPSGGNTANPLNGKKILFTGNSLTYYGQTVLGGGTGVVKQSSRNKDKGYFYQFCKENGANVSVTNWAFSGHVFSEVFGGKCQQCKESKGVDVDHSAYLTDRNYDYVVMQSGPTEGSNDITFLADVENIMNFFKDEGKGGNSNTKFVLLVPHTAYGTMGPGSTPRLAQNTLNNLKTLEGQGVIICDWGRVVMDILNKDVEIPNSTVEYTNSTFVIKDGFHPNMLSGYITTLMTYCAITGERARGKTYAFCNDTSLSPKAGSAYYSFTNFIKTYYSSAKPTNFDEVFASKNDMLGIQKIIDAYLKTKPYMSYNYQ